MSRDHAVPCQVSQVCAGSLVPCLPASCQQGGWAGGQGTGSEALCPVTIRGAGFIVSIQQRIEEKDTEMAGKQQV